jgi:hypothetical protein
MRDVARWIGELLIGRGLPTRLVLVRCALMVAASVLLFVLGGYVLFHEPDGGGGRGRLWQGLVVLAVALAFRALYELWELDATLSLASIGALVLGAMSFAAAQNAASDPELWPRAYAFGGIAVASLGLATWRARRA